jgi:hypothetical protein
VLAGRGLDEQAERAYLQAIEHDASSVAPWFNLGLVYKRRRDWAACARCNLKAAELDPRKQQPAWWNLGIAATALRDWPLARRAWTGYGIDIPPGEGPIEGKFGLAPVRLNPDGDAEVVWCHRIDPARGVVASVPLPESGHRYRDVVLHDGDSRGEREYRGRVYPVFNEIELWEKSTEPTVVAELTCPTEADADAAYRLLDAAEIRHEDWAASVNMLCKACSEGRVHQKHDHEGPPGWRTRREFGFAAEADRVAAVLESWLSAGPGRDFGGLERAL